MRRVALPWLAALTLFLYAAAAPAPAADRASPPEAQRQAPASRPRLALVIDDLGQNLHRDLRVLQFPGPVALAILPDAPHARALAEKANSAGKTVMLHMPMAPADGPYAWQPGLPQDALQHRLDDALRAVPHASGLNNHMGSEMTVRQLPMLALMTELQRRHLFFLDSRTNRGTVAAASAQQVGLASLSRDIFLDDDPSPAAVATQFREALALARRQGSVVIIGHPHRSTLALLERELPRLEEAGIDWVDMGQMIATRANRAMAAHGRDGVYR